MQHEQKIWTYYKNIQFPNAMSHNQCWASYSENVIKYWLLITPFKSNHVIVLITLFQK